MLENVPVDLLSKIGMAINSRMLYNGWHYMPGNFINCEQVDFSERDFYFQQFCLMLRIKINIIMLVTSNWILIIV